MDSDGMWWAGADACIEIADRIPVFRPLVWLSAVPLCRPLFSLGYRLVAGNRHRLGALLGLNELAPRCGGSGDGGRHR
jgi:predicted DCC family thiol-disulfide oxidoreductase YuxK